MPGRLRRTLAIGQGVLVLVLSPACLPDDQKTGSIDRQVVRGSREALEADVLIQLDSGNMAVRAGDPERARAHYRRAIDLDDGVAAAWFGMYMSARALGNADEAGEALERARSLAPGASLLQPDGETPDSLR